MTTPVDLAFSSVRALSPDGQDEVACVVARLVGIDAPYVLSEAEHREMEEAYQEMSLGELASDTDVEALWLKQLLPLRRPSRQPSPQKRS